MMTLYICLLGVLSDKGIARGDKSVQFKKRLLHTGNYSDAWSKNITVIETEN
jgi:hypothetical protein